MRQFKINNMTHKDKDFQNMNNDNFRYDLKTFKAFTFVFREKASPILIGKFLSALFKLFIVPSTSVNVILPKVKHLHLLVCSCYWVCVVLFIDFLFHVDSNR